MPPKAETGSQRERLAIGLRQVGAFGHAARIGVLDDGAGGRARRIEFGDAFERRVGIVDVVVGELLALNLARRGDAEAGVAGAVEGGALVRVFAVAHASARDGRRKRDSSARRRSGQPANQFEIAAS